jgi:hypothetical protein
MSGELREPGSIAARRADYRPDAWHEYSPVELGWWVALLLKRAGMRADPAKREKDLEDAQNYLNMLQAHMDAARGAGA